MPDNTNTSYTLGDGQPKPAGTWDYYGKLDPAHHRASPYMLTFSIAVFQWMPKGPSHPGKTKKGKGIKRFTAPVHAPHEAYEKARKFIALKESQP